MNTSQYAFTVEYLKLSKEESEIDSVAIEKYRKIWWYNTRIKEVGGLRLTDAGLKYITKYGVEHYVVTFDQPLKLSAQVLITLDNAIECPYHITSKELVVTSQYISTAFILYNGSIETYIKYLTDDLHRCRVSNENQPPVRTRN